ncbi:carboxymuconolactone decarboxylase family protein [Pseudoalteromonas pernae]|uniref:carboxymuconolactone decarboxylase family protein n=1 Tax=Pseudoalteromonas pernae TaxID=3118054 RepID=UPI003242C4B5
MAMRTNYYELAPKAMKILMAQEDYLATQFNTSATLTQGIWELVKLRVSQINQCAYCIDMHSKDLLHNGESVERIIGLNAWRDMPCYSDIEKAALAWSEHVTAAQSVDDNVYQRHVQQLGEQALLDLTLAVNAINSWNRVAKTFKPDVGSYKAR